jgi:TPR repeat protein
MVAGFAEVAERKEILVAGLCGSGGAMYMTAVPNDLQEGVRWTRKAAKKHEPQAEFNLAIFYANGQGVTTNVGEARKWFLKAAEHGVVEAQFGLGILYEKAKE